MRLPIATMLVAALLAACTGEGKPATTSPAASTTTAPDGTVVPPPVVPARPDFLHTTHHRPDGNRLVAGAAALTSAVPIDVALPRPVEWVVGVPDGEASLWVAALDDGRLFEVRRSGKAFAVVDLGIDLPPGTPFSLLRGDAGYEVIPARGSPATSPIVTARGETVWVENDGSVSSGPARHEVAALPDARLLTDAAGRILVLGGATDRYPHGVLGDRIEASTVALIDPVEGIRTAAVADDAVIEGIAPIWADVDGDGVPEILVTTSNGSLGARLTVFDENGELLAEGPPVGRGSRWRHQIAVAPLGPDGGLEIVAVLTPHIGGVVEFYRVRGDELVIAATVPGVTSHVLGSRNLDMALVVDGDGDGALEVVVLSRDLRHLIGVERVGDGAQIEWTVDIGGRLTSNLAAVERPGRSVDVAAGRGDGVLRIWPSR